MRSLRAFTVLHLTKRAYTSTHSAISNTAVTTSPQPPKQEQQPQSQPQPQSQQITHRTNPHHHDLPSFLAHAARTSLDTTTTVYSGTHYEYTVQASLSRLGLTLTRTGGASDRGIDLLGTWTLPSLPTTHPLKVLVQCKALKQKAKPALIRELEGAFIGAPVGWRGAGDWGVGDGLLARGAEVVVAEQGEREERKQDLGYEAYGEIGGARGVIGLLVTPSEATKGVRDAMARSRWPMGFMKVDLGGGVEQLLWNRSAAQRGLEGVGVVTRHVPKRIERERGDGGAETKVEKEVVLTWKREPWEWRGGE